MALGSWAKTWGGKGAEAALASLVTHQWASVPQASLLGWNYGWWLPGFELVSSQTLRTYFENESAAVSDFYHACAIAERPIESWWLDRAGWAKPRIHSVDTYQPTEVMHADDSVATGKYETCSLNHSFL